MKWHELPREIQEKMLERQLEQAGKMNPTIFEKHISASESSGGFDWDKTPEGGEFWDSILRFDDIDVFYALYPKSPIKPEHKSLYKKTFRVNRIIESQIDLEKIRELNLEHILNIPQSN